MHTQPSNKVKLHQGVSGAVRAGINSPTCGRRMCQVAGKASADEDNPWLPDTYLAEGCGGDVSEANAQSGPSSTGTTRSDKTLVAPSVQLPFTGASSALVSLGS